MKQCQQTILLTSRMTKCTMWPSFISGGKKQTSVKQWAKKHEPPFLTVIMQQVAALKNFARKNQAHLAWFNLVAVINKFAQLLDIGVGWDLEGFPFFGRFNDNIHHSLCRGLARGVAFRGIHFGIARHLWMISNTAATLIMVVWLVDLQTQSAGRFSKKHT